MINNSSILSEHGAEPWTPITSVRGVGKTAIGINTFDELVPLLNRAYPEQSDNIALVVDMVDQGLDPTTAGLMLQRIEAKD